MMMLSEPSRRRDDFDAAACAWVRLADGAEWAIPKPWLEIRARFEGGMAVGRIASYTLGSEVDELLIAIAGCTDDAVRISGVATLAGVFLRRCYELSDADLDRLLAIRASDPASLEWIGRVMDLATGRLGRRGES